MIRDAQPDKMKLAYKNNNYNIVSDKHFYSSLSLHLSLLNLGLLLRVPSV